MNKSKKEIIKRLDKTCAVCGRKIKVILYKDRTYRGGHYFGKIPLLHKKELDKAHKAGTRKVKIGDTVFNVLKKDPKPYKYEEYWECSKCYWNYK